MSVTTRLSLGMVLLLAVAAHGAIVYVPTDQPTIQAGIDAAVTGDSVVVEDGYYFENLIIYGKSITLASRFLLDNNTDHILNTVIDGSQPNHPDTGSCLIVYEPATVGTVVMGFTMTNGTGTRWRDIGDNQYYREGGAILTDITSIRIQNNLLVSNRAAAVGAITSWGGGAIRDGFGSGPSEIVGNLIAWNDAGYGGGIVIFRSSSNIKNNIIAYNTGGQAFGGGGIWAWSNLSGVTIENNTIVSNSSKKEGGGIFIQSTPALTLNNIIRDNTTNLTGPQIRFGSGSGGSSATYSNVQGGFTGTGNIDALPLYQASNFLLGVGSPSIDSGSAIITYNDVEDPPASGLAKFPSYGTIRNDQGAYGGLDAFAFPSFNDPDIAIAGTEINYGTTTTGVQRDTTVTVIKRNFGMVRVTDIQFRGPHTDELAHQATLPLASGVSGLDSLRTFPLNFFASTPLILNDTMLVFHDDSTTVSPIRILLKGTVANPTCCTGTTGNMDNDLGDAVDISDLQKMIDYLFFGAFLPGCNDEHNIDKAGGIDLADLQILVDYLFFGAPLPTCPS